MRARALIISYADTRSSLKILEMVRRIRPELPVIVRTRDDSDIDPSESYEIECMPTSEGVWRVRYATADVTEGKKPFTPQEWFSKGLYTVAQIDAAAGSETSAG